MQSSTFNKNENFNERRRIFYDEIEIRQTLSVLALGCRNDNCVDAGECVCER